MDDRVRMEDPAEDCGRWAAALIHGRRTTLPKRLAEPGPTPAQLRCILDAAAAAPDHGERLPWRFVLVPAQARSALGEAFAQALLQRDATASPDQLAQAREKALRSPVLMLAIARTGESDEDVPPAEKLLATGCAIQNMLLMATALGYGSSLTSGKAMDSSALRGLFGLQPNEQALCFVNIGTIASRRQQRARPGLDRFVSELQVR